MAEKCEHFSGLPASINVLPTRVNLSTLLSTEALIPADKQVSIGLDFDTLQPFNINWSKDFNHLLVGGISQSGRTSLLHTIVLSIVDRYSPEEAWIILVDGMQGSLRSLAQFPHVIAWISNEEDLAVNFAFLKAELEHRRKLKECNSEEPFAQIFFVIDDYDLTSEAISIPKSVQNDLGRNIRRDSDLGFHFVLSNIAQNIGRDSRPINSSA